MKITILLPFVLIAGCVSIAQPSPVELCERTVRDYGPLRDEGPAEAYADLFAANGEFHLAKNVTKGRGALIARHTASNTALKWRHNMTDIQIIEKNGDYLGKTGFHIFAGPYSETPGAFNREILGNYIDIFAIENGACKIKSRKAEIIFDKKS